MEIYKNSYTETEDRMLWELHEIIPIRYQKLINPVKCCKRFNGIFILSEFI